MKLPTASVLLLSIAGGLAGCTNPGGIVPQQFTRVETLAKAGAPTDIRFDRNGEELWEYASGPSGFETHLVRFGADGRVKEVTQLLTPERLFTVVPGQSTKQDVRHLLGRPSEVSHHLAGEAWSWRSQVGTAQPGHLVVTFNPDNTVRERMAISDPAGDRPKDRK